MFKTKIGFRLLQNVQKNLNDGKVLCKQFADEKLTFYNYFSSI
jgi:hypothetical protein